MSLKEKYLRNKVFNAYEEASILFKQGDFEEALDKYNQVISLGGNYACDDMVLRTVNAALTQRQKCQYRVLKF